VGLSRDAAGRQGFAALTKLRSARSDRLAPGASTSLAALSPVGMTGGLHLFSWRHVGSGDAVVPAESVFIEEAPGVAQSD